MRRIIIEYWMFNGFLLCLRIAASHDHAYWMIDSLWFCSDQRGDLTHTVALTSPDAKDVSHSLIDHAYRWIWDRRRVPRMKSDWLTDVLMSYRQCPWRLQQKRHPRQQRPDGLLPTVPALQSGGPTKGNFGIIGWTRRFEAEVSAVSMWATFRLQEFVIFAYASSIESIEFVIKGI